MPDILGKDPRKLGFGLLRLPKKGELTDIEQTRRMVDLFLGAGFRYFDTAFTYTGSEAAAKEALVDRYPRESYVLATKMYALRSADEQGAKAQFQTSLERTGAGYFDYYLLHALKEHNYTRYDRFGLWDFAAEQKARGRVRNVGFSFHGGPELLDQLLRAHPEVDFVQLQINYADWENPKVASRANYEVARKHGKPIVVMEPVKGGGLADPPGDVKKLFRECRPEMSFASWAVRFAASLDGVFMVLSGMSNVAQMEDNLSYMKDFRPLDAEEREAVRQARRLLEKSAAIPCTACRYCTEGCPEKIPIPEIFSAMNKRLQSGLLAEAEADYREAVSRGGRASSCIGCKQCEEACPQHLSICGYLRDAAAALEHDGGARQPEGKP